MSIESPTPKRKPEATEERIHDISHPVESVVVHTKETARVCRQNPEDPSCSHETCVQLEEEIFHSEISTVYEKCLSHEIFSFDEITLVVDHVTAIVKEELEGAGNEETAFAEEKLKLLSARPGEIRSATNQYIRALTEFHNIRRQQVRLDPEEFKEKLVSIDRQRKNSHDRLITALSELTLGVRALKEYGFLEKCSVDDWDMGLPVHSINGNGKHIQVFSKRFLENRDLVRDWAVSANLFDDISAIRKLADEKINAAK